MTRPTLDEAKLKVQTLDARDLAPQAWIDCYDVLYAEVENLLRGEEDLSSDEWPEDVVALAKLAIRASSNLREIDFPRWFVNFTSWSRG